MWGRGFQQRGVEQLAMAEAGRSSRPGGPVGRRGLTGIGAITLAGVVALPVLLADCASGSGTPADPPTPTPLDAAVAGARPATSRTQP